MDFLTKSLASELGHKGVRVIAIAPGSVKTPLLDAALNNMTANERKRLYDNIKTIYPLGRIGNSKDIGGVAVFLASEQSNWITGSIVSVDGGLTTNQCFMKIYLNKNYLRQ